MNLTSSLIYDIVNAGDDDERAQIVERGIERQDRDVITLAAAALVDAGPELIQALPELRRADLIAGLARGMQQAGGTLAAIAPRYTAALRDPQTDWAALQGELKQIISVRQTITIGEKGLNERSPQRVEAPAGPVEQQIGFAPGGRNIDSGQCVIGGSTGRAGAGDVSAPATPAGSTHGTRSHYRRLLKRHTRRLQELEHRAATAGIATPPEVAIEIEDIRAEIARIKQPLEA